MNSHEFEEGLKGGVCSVSKTPEFSAPQLSPRPLVQLSSTHYCAYTCCLYSRWSTCGLTPLTGLQGSNLEASFPLRCFQRLSLPDVATQQCRWHDNWHTRGQSTPVLSY